MDNGKLYFHPTETTLFSYRDKFIPICLNMTFLCFIKHLMALNRELGRDISNKNAENLPQVGVNSSELIFCIPWGHNKLIIDKCKNNPDKALFFVKETIENNWSRAVLLNFLDTGLYERIENEIKSIE